MAALAGVKLPIDELLEICWIVLDELFADVIYDYCQRILQNGVMLRVVLCYK